MSWKFVSFFHSGVGNKLTDARKGRDPCDISQLCFIFQILIKNQRWNHLLSIK